MGTHTIVIQYADANPPTKNVLFLEDFGTGANAKTPYIAPVYFYQPQDGVMPLRNANGQTKNDYPTQPRHLHDAMYVVSAKLNPNHFGSVPNDHSKKTNGRMLFINIGNAVGINGVMYSRKMTDIIPNKPIRFSDCSF